MGEGSRTLEQQQVDGAGRRYPRGKRHCRAWGGAQAGRRASRSPRAPPTAMGGALAAHPRGAIIGNARTHAQYPPPGKETETETEKEGLRVGGREGGREREERESILPPRPLRAPPPPASPSGRGGR